MGQLYDITPFTMLDFPGETACIAWFAGCNLRCVYCHNPDIVEGRGEKDVDELLAFLKKRAGKLTGVVFSGGEATFFSGLADLMRQARELGYKIKLDTNGARPEVLAELLSEGLLDYVALDYKCPPERAAEIVGTDRYTGAFQESLKLLIQAANSGIENVSSSQDPSPSLAKSRAEALAKPNYPLPHPPTPRLRRTRGERDSFIPAHPIGFEVRTTFHPDLMTDEELGRMIEDLDRLGYRGTYYIQNVVSFGDKTIGGIAKPERTPDFGSLPKPKSFNVAFRNFVEKGTEVG